MHGRARLGAASRDLLAGRRARGQAMVEFALVILMFLTFVMAVFEGARLGATYVALGNAAREGARVAVYVPTDTAPTRPSDLDTAVVNAVNGTAHQFVGTLSTTTADRAGCTGANSICICRHPEVYRTCAPIEYTVSGHYVDVTVNFTFQFLPFQFVTGAGGFATRASIPLQGFARARID